MKRIRPLIYFLMMTLMTLSSCSNEDLSGEGQGEGLVPLHFHVAPLTDISAQSRASAVSSATLETVGVFAVSDKQYADIIAGKGLGKTYAYGYDNVKYTCAAGILAPATEEQVCHIPGEEFAVFAYAPYEEGMTLERLLTGKGGAVSVMSDQSGEAGVAASDFLFGVPYDAASGQPSANPLVLARQEDGSVTLNFSHQRSRLVLELDAAWLYEKLGESSDCSFSDFKISAVGVPVSLDAGTGGACYSLSATDGAGFDYSESNIIMGEAVMAEFSIIGLSKRDGTVALSADGTAAEKLTATAIIFPHSFSASAETPQPLFKIEYVEDGVTKEKVLKYKESFEAGKNSSVRFSTDQRSVDAETVS